jgi:hypothetical protein
VSWSRFDQTTSPSRHNIIGKNNSGNLPTNGQFRYLDHIVNFLKFLGSFGNGKIYEWDAELLHDLISLPLDIHNHNQLSLAYTP